MRNLDELYVVPNHDFLKLQRGVAQRRMKALEDFQNKITAIDQIADGARTKAEESRRNEEQKTKEKANVIRTTGEMPGICFCFCF